MEPQSRISRYNYPFKTDGLMPPYMCINLIWFDPCYSQLLPGKTEDFCNSTILNLTTRVNIFEPNKFYKHLNLTTTRLACF